MSLFKTLKRSLLWVQSTAIFARVNSMVIHRQEFIVAKENIELRKLLTEIYEWTDYKQTDWAKRSKKALDRNV